MEIDNFEDIEIVCEEYEAYASECEAALRIALARITNMQAAMERSEERSPFDSIQTRIKSFESVIDKCSRKGYDLNIDSIKKNICDIAGIRIITPFRDDIMRIRDLLKSIPGNNVRKIKDYVTEPKPNGYSSLHLYVEIEIFLPTGPKYVPVEIQIRDKAMDMWAAVEHIIKYKNPNPSPETEAKFKEIADVLVQFDYMAIELRDFDI